MSEERFWRLTPRQFGRHARAHQERQEARNRRMCFMLDGLLNYGGLTAWGARPVPFGHHYDRLFGGGGAVDAGEKEELRRITEEHRKARRARHVHHDTRPQG